jgi:hypothetical protein
MTIIIEEVYTAFKDVGVSDEKAKNAAKALSEYKEEFREVERRFNKVDIEIAEIKGMLRLHNWMMGFQFAIMTAVLFLLLRISL